MKLLFDQNLACRLVTDLRSLYPDSQHIRDLGLESASDDVIWSYALEHNLTIVSKDSDFYHRSMLFGNPPKVIWIRIGNCTTAEIIDFLQARYTDLLIFDQDSNSSFLVLP